MDHGKSRTYRLGQGEKQSMLHINQRTVVNPAINKAFNIDSGMNRFLV